MECSTLHGHHEDIFFIPVTMATRLVFCTRFGLPPRPIVVNRRSIFNRVEDSREHGHAVPEDSTLMCSACGDARNRRFDLANASSTIPGRPEWWRYTPDPVPCVFVLRRRRRGIQSQRITFMSLETQSEVKSHRFQWWKCRRNDEKLGRAPQKPHLPFTDATRKSEIPVLRISFFSSFKTNSRNPTWPGYVFQPLYHENDNYGVNFKCGICFFLVVFLAIKLYSYITLFVDRLVRKKKKTMYNTRSGLNTKKKLFTNRVLW